MEQPKFKKYAGFAERLKSFETWQYTYSREKLAEAGFFYFGLADRAICYYCGAGLRNWEKDNDPWVEHEIWYPGCPHVRQVKGQGFTKEVEQTPIPSENDNAVQSCLQMGFTRSDVRQAMLYFVSVFGGTKITGGYLCEVILKMQEAQATKTEFDIKAIGMLLSNSDEEGESSDEISTEETDQIKEIKELLEGDAAKSCLQNGFTKNVVKKAIQRFISNNGHTDFTGEQLCEIIYNTRETETPSNFISVGTSSLKTERRGQENIYIPTEENSDTQSNDNTSAGEQRSELEQSASERTQTENLMESDAAQSCLQNGFAPIKVQAAIKRYIETHGSTHFKGEDLCEILQEVGLDDIEEEDH